MALSFLKYQKHLRKFSAIFNEKSVPFLISRCLSEQKRTQLQGEIRTFFDNHSYVLYTSTAEACNQTFNDKKTSNNLGESFTSESSIWQFPWNKHTFYENSENIFAKGYDALEDYVHGYMYHTFDDTQVLAAFTALERFYDNKDKHEVSLKQLQSLKSEASVTALLCTHLLSQLLFIPRNYFFDSVSKRKPLFGCPCGCGASIQYGSTSFGSPHLFHGGADVVLFPTNKDIIYNMDAEPNLAVFNVEDPERTGTEILELDMSNSEEDFIEGENDDEIRTSTMENEAFTEFSEADINQTVKQSIAVSLWKYKRSIFDQPNDSVPMVPVCLINKYKFMVAMYNAEHDYLLRMKKTDSLTIFKDGKLQFSAILNLWLLIHHNLFCTKPHVEATKNLKGTCGLVARLGSENFETVVKTSKFNYDVLPRGDNFEPDMTISQPATRWKRPSKYRDQERVTEPE